MDSRKPQLNIEAALQHFALVPHAITREHAYKQTKITMRLKMLMSGVEG